MYANSGSHPTSGTIVSVVSRLISMNCGRNRFSITGGSGSRSAWNMVRERLLRLCRRDSCSTCSLWVARPALFLLCVSFRIEARGCSFPPSSTPKKRIMSVVVPTLVGLNHHSTITRSSLMPKSLAADSATSDRSISRPIENLSRFVLLRSTLRPDPSWTKSLNASASRAVGISRLCLSSTRDCMMVLLPEELGPVKIVSGANLRLLRFSKRLKFFSVKPVI